MTEKYVYKKRFYDLEKEESWLNEMCAEGLVLKNIKYGFLRDRYIFEHCEKKYVCRVDYNPEMAVMEEITSPYTMFVTDTYGAEFICCSGGKLYFRKAEESGDFPPVYTSLDSRISAEKKQLWRLLPLIIIIMTDLFYIGRDLINGSNILKLSTVCFAFSLVFSVPVITGIFRHISKIRSLKRLAEKLGE